MCGHSVCETAIGYCGHSVCETGIGYRAEFLKTALEPALQPLQQKAGSPPGRNLVRAQSLVRPLVRTKSQLSRINTRYLAHSAALSSGHVLIGIVSLSSDSARSLLLFIVADWFAVCSEHRKLNMIDLSQQDDQQELACQACIDEVLDFLKDSKVSCVQHKTYSSDRAVKDLN